MSAKGPSSKALYHRLLKHVWPYRAALFVAMIAMAVGGLSDAALLLNRFNRADDYDLCVVLKGRLAERRKGAVND